MPQKKTNMSFEFYANKDNTSQIITNILVFHNWVKKDWIFIKMVTCLGNYCESMIFWYFHDVLPQALGHLLAINDKILNKI